MTGRTLKYFKGAIFLTLLSACSRFALIIPDAERENGEVNVRIPENLRTLETKVSRWLKLKDKLEKTIRPSADSKRVFFITPWTRALSLRFYYLDFDQRMRHLSEWKAQWTLRALGANDSKLTVKVLELLFTGPIWNVPPLPELANQKQNSVTTNTEWTETDPDKLRATLELRRFWSEVYPLIPLPSELAGPSVSSLEGPPVSKDWTQKKWKPLKRPKSF